MSGIYLHIPFCKQACSYCDFYFVTRQNEKQRFVDQLISEIRSKENSEFTQENIHTIYFGGGTPSLLDPAQVDEILTEIDTVFNLDLKEVTLEMNPDDVTADYLNGLKEAGITRASMGVQTFDEDLLHFMNRAHSREEAIRCLELLSASGMNSFTVDLIYGNPGQSLKMLEKDIEILLGFNPPHVSAYSLTIEPRTRLGKQLELGRLIEPEDDKVASHFDMVVDKLGEAGIRQYEVSNYAVQGHEAVHNSAYWSHENYLGFGPGAHSFWWNKDGRSARRWSNEPDLKNYFQKGRNEKFEEEILGLASLAEERIMLGLRTKKGIDLDVLNSRYEFKLSDKNRSYLSKKESEGKLIKENSRIYLTREGLKVSDAIVLDLIS